MNTGLKEQTVVSLVEFLVQHIGKEVQILIGKHAWRYVTVIDVDVNGKRLYYSSPDFAKPVWMEIQYIDDLKS